MAKRVIEELVDDIDGSKAVRTVAFSLDGRAFEIDLSEDNVARMQGAFEPFVSAGRQVRGIARSTQKPGNVSRKRQDLREIRSWASQHGYNVGEKGRIPGHIVEAYEKANA